MSHDDLTPAYEEQMALLLQEGPAWEGFRAIDGTGRQLIRAKADGFASVHARFDQLLEEALPWWARETLPTREVEAGLPDICSQGRATTLPERQQAVAAKWLGAGAGHRPGDFEALAATMGYEVVVEAGRSFRCGISRCGVDALDPSAANVTLIISVFGPRHTRFQCGVSQCGIDPLLKVQIAEDLECRIRKKAHSHVNVIFRYFGPPLGTEDGIGLAGDDGVRLATE